MFEVIGSHSKCGVVFETMGLQSEQWGGLETVGSRSKQWDWARNGELAFKVVGSSSKRRTRVRSSGVGLETAGSHSKQWGWA